MDNQEIIAILRKHLKGNDAGFDYVAAARKIQLGPVHHVVNVPMKKGVQPTDGGNLLLSEKERSELVSEYPSISIWIRPLLGAKEFLQGKVRYCFWLAETTAVQRQELNNIPTIRTRFNAVKDMRLDSSDKGTREKADTPWLFRESTIPDTYILLPSVSSERRKYVPMGFFDSNTISTNLNLMIPNAGLYEFALLNSQMHMDWMRTVAGRLKSDYRYSAKLVYNNFPWPEANETQQKSVEKLAQKILDSRQIEVDKDPNTTLADLYDPCLMPPILRKAHKNLDRAVDKLYRKKIFNSSLERVKYLFERYAELTSNE